MKRSLEFVLTTRNAEGRQCYNERDHVTVKIEDERGRECATEVRINDNIKVWTLSDQLFSQISRHMSSPGYTQKRVYALRHESIVQKVRSKH